MDKRYKIIQDYATSYMQMSEKFVHAEVNIMEKLLLQQEKKLKNTLKKLDKLVLQKGIYLNGHIEKRTNFWITIHCPNSGMKFDILKKDIIIKKRLNNGIKNKKK